jgi:molybdopterin-guanine dinucleotide biosynthesis protein A
MSGPIFTAAGFVLAGGRSTRMGTDKAVLVCGGRTLLERAASAVLEALGNVMIIADPVRYAHFGFPVIADDRPGCGPLGGVVTALRHSRQNWNIVVACDMPNLSGQAVKWLLEQAAAAGPGPDCVVPLSLSGPEPLCAAYHVKALTKLQDALDRNILKMRRVLEMLDTRLVCGRDSRTFVNINTPEDWAAHE